MEDFYTKKITNSKQAISFMVNLRLENKLFHFADDASDIISSNNERLFTDEEAKEVDKRVHEVFRYVEDPFTHILRLTKLELLITK